jgi:hypothetical protein
LIFLKVEWNIKTKFKTIMIHTHPYVLVRRDIEAVGIAMFSEEIIPTTKTSRSLISADGRILLEGFRVVRVMKDSTGVGENTLWRNDVVLIVLMGGAVRPNEFSFQGCIVNKSAVLIVIVASFHVGWELGEGDRRKVIRCGWSQGGNRYRGCRSRGRWYRENREISFVAADMIEVVFVKVRVEEERSAINENDEFAIRRCGDKLIEGINEFLMISKTTAGSLCIFEIQGHVVIDKNVNARDICSTSAGLSDKADDLKANEINSSCIDSVAIGVKNGIEVNGIFSDAVNLVVRETKRDCVNAVKDSHDGKKELLA